MSDNDDLDIEGGESPEGSSTYKKKSALGALLPTILKFVAIGIGATIFIVTVVLITMGFNQPSEWDHRAAEGPFMAVPPQWSWFTDIGTVNTQTIDTPPRTVSVVMHLGFEQGDATTSSELFGRQIPLQAFTRNYFAQRTADELRPENEARLRREIMDILNTRYLDRARIRDVQFVRLDVMDVF